MRNYFAESRNVTSGVFVHITSDVMVDLEEGGYLEQGGVSGCLERGIGWLSLIHTQHNQGGRILAESAGGYIVELKTSIEG